VTVYWLMLEGYRPLKSKKDWSNENLDFWLCNLGLHTIKRGCLMKSWGEIILVQNIFFHPFCNLLERTLQKSCCWRFSRWRLWPSEPETLAFKAGDSDPEMETPAGESGLPILFFTQVVQASVACPESLRSPTRNSKSCHIEAGDSSPYRPETPGGTRDSGPYRPKTSRLVNPDTSQTYL
jgi:hypothetical protein